MNIVQTCTACPSQWEITLDDGRALYVRYRYATLTVDEMNDGKIGRQLFCKEVGDNPLAGVMDTAEMLHLTHLDWLA
jgi:hypothetical protein